MLQPQQSQLLHVFKQWNQTLSVQKISPFSPSRCRQSSVLLIHLPCLSPVSNDSKSFSVTTFWRASSHISAVLMVCLDGVSGPLCVGKLSFMSAPPLWTAKENYHVGCDVHVNQICSEVTLICGESYIYKNICLTWSLISETLYS